MRSISTTPFHTNGLTLDGEILAMVYLHKKINMQAWYKMQ